MVTLNTQAIMIHKRNALAFLELTDLGGGGETDVCK